MHKKLNTLIHVVVLGQNVEKALCILYKSLPKTEDTSFHNNVFIIPLIFFFTNTYLKVNNCTQ